MTEGDGGPIDERDSPPAGGEPAVQSPDRTGAETSSGLGNRLPSWRTVARHLVVLVFAVALAVAPLAVANGSLAVGDPPPERQATLDQPACTPVDEESQRPSVRAAIERADDKSRVTVTYDLSASDAPRDFAVSTAQSELEVVNSSGFESAGIDEGRYEWTGSAQPSLTYEVPVDGGQGSLAEDSPRFAVGEDWVLTPLPQAIGERVDYDPEPSGVVSPAENGLRIAYLGALRTTNATHGCQTISIHTPPDSDASGEEISTAVADAAAQYPVGQRPAHVEGVVVPLEGTLGGYTVGRFFTINPTSNLSVETIAVHEYVHTRQRAEYSPEMQWFVEGQPAFYMFNLRYQTDGMSTAEYALRMHTFHQRSQWGASFRSETNINHYYRGAATLAALDFRIRAATDGKRSLLDVVDRLERQNDTVGIAEFKTAVENVSGRSMDSWIQRHVIEGEPVDVAAPDNGTLSRGTWETVAAYELLTDSIPGAVVFYVFVWYSILLFVTRLVGGVAGRVR